MEKRKLTLRELLERLGHLDFPAEPNQDLSKKDDDDNDEDSPGLGGSQQSAKGHGVKQRGFEAGASSAQAVSGTKRRRSSTKTAPSTWC